MMLRQPWRSLVGCERRPPENSLKKLEGLEIFCSYPEMMRIKMKVKLSLKVLRWRKMRTEHWRLEQIKVSEPNLSGVLHCTMDHGKKKQRGHTCKSLTSLPISFLG